MTSLADIEALPVLPSLDLAETQQFFVDKLNFEATAYESENYLIVRRENIELHFWLTQDRALCENTSVYIRGGAIDELHAEFSSKQVERMSGLQVRPWGMGSSTSTIPMAICCVSAVRIQMWTDQS